MKVEEINELTASGDGKGRKKMLGDVRTFSQCSGGAGGDGRGVMGRAR